MERERRKNLRIYFLAILTAGVVFIWYGVFTQNNDGMLTLAFLDVGQGDAIFIESPDGVQILIDGGATQKVLRELSKVMPFYDRSLDIVLATHPDLDHIGGLPAVFDSYKVDTFIEPPYLSDADAQRALHERVAREGAEHMQVMRGTRIALGESVSLLVLFPDRVMDGADPNDASLIVKLVFNNTSFLLTGDAPSKIEKYLSSLYGKELSADVLKAGHHGSNTSSSETFIGFVAPQLAVISAGKDNRYGHPHREVVERFSQFGTSLLETSKQGAIVITSDGETFFVD